MKPISIGLWYEIKRDLLLYCIDFRVVLCVVPYFRNCQYQQIIKITLISLLILNYIQAKAFIIILNLQYIWFFKHDLAVVIKK
jgi:hypothetical protein